MPRGSAHRGIMTHTHIHTTRLLYASWLRPPRHNEAPKVQMPRWNDTLSTNTTVHHFTDTATAGPCIQDFCTAITIQCFSYAIRSQSVLTTIQLGVSTVFSMHAQQSHAYHERDSFHSLLTQFLWTCAAIL